MARAEAFAAIPAISFTMTKAALRADASRLMAADAIDEVIEVWSSAPVRAAINAYLERWPSGLYEPAPGAQGL